MGNINLSRVIVGGLATGIALNVLGFLYRLVFGEQMIESLANLGVAEPGGGVVAILIALGLVLGLVLVWLYAAIRPRFGGGPGTAVHAAVLIWIPASLIPAVSFALLGMFPASDMAIGTVFDLIAMAACTVLGAWLYREGPVPTA